MDNVNQFFSFRAWLLVWIAVGSLAAVVSGASFLTLIFGYWVLAVIFAALFTLADYMVSKYVFRR